MQSSISFVLITLIVSTVALEATFGVAPDQLERYSGDSFKCGDGKTIPASHINDDYCDCADGSDEPGTSACPSGTFYCANKGFQGTSIPSSWVNDGICDCCDGSDEAHGSAKCEDTCKQKAQEAYKDTIEQIENCKKGIVKRAQFIAEYKAAKATKAQDIAKLTQEVEELKAKSEKLKEDRDRITNEYNSLKDQLEPEPEPEQPVEDSDEESGDENDRVEDEVVDDDDYHFPQSEYDKEDEEDPEPEEEKVLTAEDYELARLSEEKENINRECDSAEGAVRSKQRELDEANNFLEIDFGKEGEHYGLWEKKVEYKTSEYTYEVTGFKEVYQRGGSHVKLGTFSEWEDDYSVMVYNNGQTCWQGPARSIKVTLSCGTDFEILAVEEPEKCTYTMNMRSPSACTQELLDKLEASMA